MTKTGNHFHCFVDCIFRQIHMTRVHETFTKLFAGLFQDQAGPEGELADALLAPYLAPDRFREFMTRVTDLWLETRRLLRERIGPEYRNPFDETAWIAECSVNLVSPEFYREHILPHDRRLAALTGQVRIHTCSGPHVFRVTLESLPVIETEAGRIERTAAGYTPVAEAFAAVRGRPILLNVGQEIYDDDAFDLIRRDLDLYRQHPAITFGYTGMNWRRKDRPFIRALHRRLDEYWAGASGNN